MKMFFPPKSLSCIICHPFQMMSNINKCTISIQKIKIFLKGRPLGINQLKRLNQKIHDLVTMDRFKTTCPK
jgi:hypothetical protein